MKKRPTLKMLHWTTCPKPIVLVSDMKKSCGLVFFGPNAAMQFVTTPSTYPLEKILNLS